MLNVQFNIKLINILKEILLSLRHEEPLESIQADFDQHVKNVGAVNLLLSQRELTNVEYATTIEEYEKFFITVNTFKKKKSPVRLASSAPSAAPSDSKTRPTA